MSMTKDCTTTKPSSTTARSSCFLGCFGCSGEKVQPKDKVNVGSRRRLISKWNFYSKKSATKTVPVELNTTSRKSKSFQLSEKHSPETSDTTWESQVVVEDATLTKKSVIMVEGNHGPATSDGKNIRPKKRTGILKHQNGSSRSSRNETKAAAPTATGAGLDLPGEKSVTISSPVKPLTHSTSSPKEKKTPYAPQTGGGADKGAFDKPPPSAGGFDSVIGMSVILVTLVIMVLWGKLCAILCTSAWFFVAPRLVAAGERSTGPTPKKRRQDSHNNLDLESMEYKKRVVLEGLLQRNHRNVVGRL
ncbi:hypothetical protein L2E82_42348 [Cichorium intybus]|uniref:Uncharacterized protein n=1 Tax=Cichorium intybus TaxID=13427 RepID=A0ACB8ZLN7_CICIN|nr:hypothetical protein L2E82_42348 [Cichorium intybus]